MYSTYSFKFIVPQQIKYVTTVIYKILQFIQRLKPELKINTGARQDDNDLISLRPKSKAIKRLVLWQCGTQSLIQKDFFEFLEQVS